MRKLCWRQGILIVYFREHGALKNIPNFKKGAYIYGTS